MGFLRHGGIAMIHHNPGIERPWIEHAHAVHAANTTAIHTAILNSIDLISNPRTLDDQHESR